MRLSGRPCTTTALPNSGSNLTIQFLGLRRGWPADEEIISPFLIPDMSLSVRALFLL
jgi:hypothetical protein